MRYQLNDFGIKTEVGMFILNHVNVNYHRKTRKCCNWCLHILLFCDLDDVYGGPETEYQ